MLAVGYTAAGAYGGDFPHISAEGVESYADFFIFSLRVNTDENKSVCLSGSTPLSPMKETPQ